MSNKITPELHTEHAKLKAVADDSQKIGEFLAWLDGQGVRLAMYEHPEDRFLTPTTKRIEDWLAEYFGINREALESEKRAMLDELRGGE